VARRPADGSAADARPAPSLTPRVPAGAAAPYDGRMLTPQAFLDSCAHETRVLCHLATKVSPDAYDWRPTPNQRSTAELLGYLTTCAIVPARAMVSGAWDDFETVGRAERAVTPSSFPWAMAQQMQALTTLVRAIPERDFLDRDATLPWGAKEKLGVALVDTALKALVAYRMQLFLYAKASGNAALGPANCWVGVDGPPSAG